MLGKSNMSDWLYRTIESSIIIDSADKFFLRTRCASTVEKPSQNKMINRLME